MAEYYTDFYQQGWDAYENNYPSGECNPPCNLLGYDMADWIMGWEDAEFHYNKMEINSEQ